MPRRVSTNVKRLRRRTRLERLQGGLCAYCFEPMDPARLPVGPYNPRASTMDEVVPQCRGGRLDRNTVAVHESCNQWKDSRQPTGCELLALEWVNALVEDDPLFVNGTFPKTPRRKKRTFAPA